MTKYNVLFGCYLRTLLVDFVSISDYVLFFPGKGVNLWHYTECLTGALSLICEENMILDFHVYVKGATGS